MKRRVFFDMDGTLCVFRQVDEKQIYQRNYFLELPPHERVVEAAKRLNDSNVEVYVLSAVLEDSQYALAEKNQWLDRFLPAIDRSHRIFLPCGAEKGLYIQGGIRETDLLIDDYTANLIPWSKKGKALKLINGINGKNGVWKGEKIHYSDPPERLCRAILDAI